MFIIGVASVVGLSALLYVVFKMGVEVGKNSQKSDNK